MKLDILKSAWKDTSTEIRDPEEIRLMSRENKHPVLKSTRRQLTIEIVIWTIFLFFYYDFFDGDRKPLYLNLLLVASVLFVLIHSIIGYIFTRNLVHGNNLKKSLENHLSKIKRYAIISISSRVLSIICVLLFFTLEITFGHSKYLMLIGILLLLIPFQIIMLYRIWSKRINKLRKAIEEFN